MRKQIDDLIEQIKELENELSFELEKELATIRQRLNYTIEQGKVRFQESALAGHKALKMDLYHFLRESSILFFLTSPIIYSFIIPLVLLDLLLTLYQLICFPIYRIKKVVRDDYIMIDRHHLAYLNIIEKVNCTYCGYANGLLSYGLEIASRTEAYWCPIKHAKKPRDAHSRYQSFLEYGDAEGYREKLNTYRQEKEK